MNPRSDSFLRVAAATPRIRVADAIANADAILAAVREAADAGVHVLALPELCLTGYTCGDLFGDSALLGIAESQMERILQGTRELPMLFTVGVPVAVGHGLYNCVAVCCHGRLLGLTAKAYLPTHGEFYERRWFTAADPRVSPRSIAFAGQSAPLGAGIVYACHDEDLEDVRIGVEVCEDLWVPNPPSTAMAVVGGATVILNASASDEVVGKSAYRRDLVRGQSARLYCAYAYADAGEGESTTDLVFAGENLVAENGVLLAATEPFTCGRAVAEVDLCRLAAERRRSTTWGAGCASLAEAVHEVPFSFAGEDACDGALEELEDEYGEPDRCPGEEPLRLPGCAEIDRVFPRAPFVPAEGPERAARCESILATQAAGLATRLAHTGTRHLVVGLSGGLDSTLALLVGARALDRLGIPRANLHAVSMPGFGTTGRTKGNAQKLAEGLGVDFREIPIGEAVERHFAAIGHDPEVRDVTYENAQARERTQILMDLSNELGGLVVGTGDLSELALGWATYNADHMSMYGVNAGVPKTLVRHLVAFEAGRAEEGVAAVLADILDTPVSPELLPPTGDGEIAQRTEDLVGPYELHDYFLYYLLRFGFSPTRIYAQAVRSFEGVYEPEVIRHWLRTFYRRFFAQQFKRSCLPDGPKVGSVTLSPRGDWRMPSDAAARLWLEGVDWA